MKYWINCVSKDHVLAGVAGKFTQAGHGKAEPLKRLSNGDLMAFYSAGTTYRAGQLVQAFTALGRVVDERAHQVHVSGTFQPWRRHMDFFSSEEAPIAPLIPELAFIEDKENWGMPLKRGFFEISAEDFSRIAAAMKTLI